VRGDGPGGARRRLAALGYGGARVATALNHYSLLRTAEQLLGLSPLLGAAASAPSMVSAFNL
jgi:hypothetical protein